jgi:hypothetical protein
MIMPIWAVTIIKKYEQGQSDPIVHTIEAHTSEDARNVVTNAYLNRIGTVTILNVYRVRQLTSW